jgi:hypothetical protein
MTKSTRKIGISGKTATVTLACLACCIVLVALRVYGLGAKKLNSSRHTHLALPAETQEKDLGNRQCDELTDLLQRRQYRELDAALRFAGTKNPLRWLDWTCAVDAVHREEARYAVLSGWYHARPGEMILWTGKNECAYFSSEQFREAAVESGSIPDALRGLGLITDESPRKTQITDVFAGLASRDINQALKAADGLDPASRQAALLGALRFLTAESPELAMEVADAYSDGTTGSYSLLKAAVDIWIAQKGIDAVQGYFSHEPVSKDLDGGYAALASACADKHPGDCSNWLNRISNPALKEQIAVAVIAQITDSNPEIASRLVADLIDSTPGGSNEGVTIVRLESTVRPWLRKDPPAAFSYVYSLSALSSPGRRALLQKLALLEVQ